MCESLNAYYVFTGVQQLVMFQFNERKSIINLNILLKKTLRGKFAQVI